MDFITRHASAPARLGILPGSFNPITTAHVALAQSALSELDEVLVVMPRELPHKAYDGVGLDDRLAMVCRSLAGIPRFSVAVSGGGLFVEIARECRPHYGDNCELWFLCGRDAAERIVNWDYGGEGGLAGQLEEFGLMVAERQGRYTPPDEYRHKIRPLQLAGDWNHVSATGIRERIQAGQEWAHLVPEAIAGDVIRLYGRR
jgi:nicotinate-nucleotide adenylyltransferase